MNEIIYAPIIGDTIPGFSVNGEIKIPFQMNSAVSQAEIEKFSLLVKDYNGSNEFTLEVNKKQKFFENNIVEFSIINLNNFVPLKYYKFQLGYLGEELTTNIIYSPVSIGKCVGNINDFEVKINDLITNNKELSNTWWNYTDENYNSYVWDSEYIESPFNYNCLKFSRLPDYFDEYDHDQRGLIYSTTRDVNNNSIGSGLDISRIDETNVYKIEKLDSWTYSDQEYTQNDADSFSFYAHYLEEYEDVKAILYARNINLKTYTALYSTTQLTEPLYSYRFIFKENIDNGEILSDTGEILWNVDNDEIISNNRISTFNFNYYNDLEDDKEYSLLLFCTTINGYTISSQEYIIIKENEEDWEVDMLNKDFLATQDKDGIENGYIELTFGISKGGKHNFLLERKEDNGVFKTIKVFEFNAIGPFEFSWKDLAIQQGVKYTYGLRYKLNNNWTKRKEAIIEISDYEYMFLSDSNRLLKIKFDPKISSFKDTILEQKTDTIGSRYPFFFRNAQVKYKEIPISGLISYLLDNENFFFTEQEKKENLGISNDLTLTQTTEIRVPTTNLVAYNIAAERKFKLAVLEWLNNGEPKLFRSPTEGIYVIRLSNITLSPNDTLGRLLHSFSAIGYECMDNDPETLFDNKLLPFNYNIVIIDTPSEIQSI